MAWGLNWGNEPLGVVPSHLHLQSFAGFVAGATTVQSLCRKLLRHHQHQAVFATICSVCHLAVSSGATEWYVSGMRRGHSQQGPESGLLTLHYSEGTIIQACNTTVQLQMHYNEYTSPACA